MPVVHSMQMSLALGVGCWVLGVGCWVLGDVGVDILGILLNGGHLIEQALPLYGRDQM